MPPTTYTVSPLAIIDEIGNAAVKALTKRKVQFADYNNGSTVGGQYLGVNGWNYSIGNAAGVAPDFTALAGDVLQNRVVAACVNAKARAMASAPSIIERLNKGQWERIDHEAAQLLNVPNDYHSYYDLQFATTAYEDTKAQGFWRIEFDRSGTPAEIWPEHPDKFRIKGSADKYISGYTFTQEAGGTIELEDREVIHFRRALDLYNGRLGWTPLQAGHAQIHGDNAAAIYQSAILDNAGIMSLLISLKEGLQESKGVVTTQLQDMVEQLKRKLRGRGQGAIVGLNLPLDVHKMGYSPDEMAISELIRYFMVSICALMGVDPAMIHMAGGVDSPTYANFEIINKDFWNRTIAPTNLQRDATLTTQYLPLWGLDSKTHRVNRDYSNIPAMQENAQDVSTRVCNEFAKGIIDRYTAKKRLKYEANETDKEVYAAPSASPSPSPGQPGEAAPPPVEAKSWALKYDATEARDKGGKWTASGEAGSKAKPRVPEPQPSEKALRAKAAHKMVDKEIQRYAEEHNEPRFAKSMGGVSFPDGEPVDIVIADKTGKLAHGIELKTVVDNKNGKITMKRDAMDRKAAWEEKNKAPVHTVVLDDSQVFNANGPGLHDESKRRILYRRGYGSFRIDTMHEVKDYAELKKLLNTTNDKLPKGAKRYGS